MDERAALFGDGIFDGLMCVAQRVDADAAQQVEIARALFVDEVDALAAHKENRIAVVSGKQQPRFSGLNLFELVFSIHLSWYVCPADLGHHHFGAVGYAGAAQVG